MNLRHDSANGPHCNAASTLSLDGHGDRPVTPALRFDLTKSDLDALASHHADESPHLRNRIRRMRLLWAGIFGLIAWEYSKTSVPGALAFLALGAAYVAGYGPLNRFLYVRQSRNLNAAPETPRLGPVTLRFEQGRLRVESSEGAATVQPQAIRRIAETPAHWFLYVGPTAAVIVPKMGVEGGDPAALVAAVREATPV